MSFIVIGFAILEDKELASKRISDLLSLTTAEIIFRRGRYDSFRIVNWSLALKPKKLLMASSEILLRSLFGWALLLDWLCSLNSLSFKFPMRVRFVSLR